MADDEIMQMKKFTVTYGYSLEDTDENYSETFSAKTKQMAVEHIYDICNDDTKGDLEIIHIEEIE